MSNKTSKVKIKYIKDAGIYSAGDEATVPHYLANSIVGKGNAEFVDKDLQAAAVKKKKDQEAIMKAKEEAEKSEDNSEKKVEAKTSTGSKENSNKSGDSEKGSKENEGGENIPAKK